MPTSLPLGGTSNLRKKINKPKPEVLIAGIFYGFAVLLTPSLGHFAYLGMYNLQLHQD
jgi:hypothetical protein